MSTTATTVSAIKAISDLLARFLEAPAKRRDKRLTDLIAPLHDSFQRVHIEYGDMLKSFRSGLPRRDENGNLSIPGRVESISEEEAASIVITKKAELRESRKQRESHRDWLRGNASVLLEVITEPQERRYLYSLIVYFLPNDYEPSPDDSILDLRISQVLRDGGNSALRTPTSRLLLDIRGKVDGDAVRDAIDSALARLNQRCNDVIRAYVRLVSYNIRKSS